ncbi:MAG: CotH kinase family protein [Clostridia bacterium]|nr:CotH kinase family protein [Clostridia bacterium]
MKKILLLLFIFLALCFVLISCDCEHSFSSANCQAPKTCVSCGATEGEIGTHLWQNNTCLSLGVCQICGVTEEREVGHQWSSELCTLNKICRVCQKTEDGREHSWDTTKCLETPTCLDCGFVGNEISHNWKEASCIFPKHCRTCGERAGEALGHSWIVTTCKEPKVCERCEQSTTEDLPHQWLFNGCDEKRTCTVCSNSEGFVYGHRWAEATCLKPKECENCDETQGSALGHNYELILKIEPICEDGKEVYSCKRCESKVAYSGDVAQYGYHICDSNGLCLQCNKQFDTSELTLESVLLTNEHSVKYCGLFTSKHTAVNIYKPITYEDVGMPVVDLGGSLPTSKGYTNTVDFTYESDELSIDCTAEIKVQGASSAGKPKKNFNIKLFKEDGSKNKVKLVDSWGKENKYCLKANYIDYSQSRNVVSGKIFGEIVKSRNDELVNTPNGGAIDGFPILVYNNGVYQGLYTLNIPKDNWMFDMSHSDEKNQAIFMTETWNQAVSFREISTSGFVLEYASNEDSLIDNNTQWAYDSMLDLIEFVYNNDGEAFKNGIHQYADIDKCIDSMLYTFFICADDNTSKNILWVTLDGKVWFSSMYDMDGTWGMRWNGNIEFNENTHPISALIDGKGLAPERNHSNLNLLWERIYVNYFDRVCQRYLELRQEILTYENISNHFNSFFDSIPDVVREAEKKKWTGVPSQSVNHLNQILTFAEKRLEAMDKILLTEE